MSYGGKLYYNPGMPEVRAFAQDAMMDTVTRYDMTACTSTTTTSIR